MVFFFFFLNLAAIPFLFADTLNFHFKLVCKNGYAGVFGGGELPTCSDVNENDFSQHAVPDLLLHLQQYKEVAI